MVEFSDSDDSDEEEEELDEDGLRNIERPLVFCNDPEEFIYTVVMDRHLDPEDVTVKLGLDDGQKILKVTAQVLTQQTEDTDESKGKRAKYSEGVAPGEHKEGSVNKLLLLAATPEVPELYTNLKEIFKHIDLSSFDWTGSSDIKMILIIIGKDQASCRHACPYCEDKAPWTSHSHLNTLGSLRAWHKKWVEDGSDPKMKKNYQNMANLPLLEGDDEDLILLLFVPPPLHLLLGITDKLLVEICKNVFKNQVIGEKFMRRFFKENNITVEGKRGGKLNGNSCRDLLNALDNLERSFQQHSLEVYIKGLPFINALRKFNAVRVKTFGLELEEGWAEAIQDFEKAYRDIRNKDDKPISVTPKAHITFAHLKDFFDLQEGEKVGKGLGYWSEQALEASHANFKKVWLPVVVPISHPSYNQKLKDTVSRYNGRHI